MKKLLSNYADLWPAAVAMFTDAAFLMIAVGIMVFIDWVTGTLAAKKAGEKIRSNGYRNTVIKGILYGAGIVVGLILQLVLMQLLGLESLPIVEAVSTFILYVEVKSIGENIEKGTGTKLSKLLTKYLPKPEDEDKGN